MVNHSLSTYKIKSQNILSKNNEIVIKDFSLTWDNHYLKLHNFFKQTINIQSSIDKDIIDTFSRDWSNIPGYANLLIHPKTIKECSIAIRTCYYCNIPITISAGKTNLTGSATPQGGVILSTSLLTKPDITIDTHLNEATSPIGIPLEILRNEILKLSNNKYYYPVDPTSRHDALVGGTLSSNASGFIPGEKGATRYWVSAIELILPSGYIINAKRGDYISKSGIFEIQTPDGLIRMPIPKYKRPKIKNASGPFSNPNGKIDFVDLIIGSEGIFGLITSCKFKLTEKPKDYLELFLSLRSEEKAIDFHDFLFKHFNNDMSQLTALEYFGFNSQQYMKHKNFLFNNSSDVGIYIQIPIYKSSIDLKSEEWVKLINSFDNKINLDDIIVLNEPLNWKKFFEARHSIPDNALTKTRRLGGISIITDTIVPPNNYRKYLQLIHSKLNKENIEYLLFGHLGDCHLHFHLIPTDKQDKKCLQVYDYMIDLSSKLGGVYSAEHGTGKRKRSDFKKCYGDKAVEMVRKSKLSVDPYLILNRGNVFN